MVLSLIVILGCRWLFGPQFESWGWRVPFLLSIILLRISVYVRLQLQESPVFHEMRAHGRLSKQPLRESIARWSNLELVLLALFVPSIAFAMIAYTGNIYSGLWYPVIVCLMTFAVGTTLLRETNGIEAKD
jgi:MFS family permease